MNVKQLMEAGFTDQEIQAHIFDKTKEWREAGFEDTEIRKFFGLPENTDLNDTRDKAKARVLTQPMPAEGTAEYKHIEDAIRLGDPRETQPTPYRPKDGKPIDKGISMEESMGEFFFGNWNEMSADNQVDLATAIYPVALPWLKLGYTSGFAFNLGMRNLVMAFDVITEAVLSELRERGEEPSDIEKWVYNFWKGGAQLCEDNAQFWADEANRVGVNYVDQLFGRMFGGFIPGAMHFMLGTVFAGLEGAAEARVADKGWGDTIMQGLLAAAKRHVLGKLFHAYAELKRGLRMPLMGVTMSVEGQTWEERFEGFGTGLFLGSMGGPGQKDIKGVVRDYKLMKQKWEPDLYIPKHRFPDIYDHDGAPFLQEGKGEFTIGKIKGRMLRPDQWDYYDIVNRAKALVADEGRDANNEAIVKEKVKQIAQAEGFVGIQHIEAQPEFFAEMTGTKVGNERLISLTNEHMVNKGMTYSLSRDELLDGKEGYSVGVFRDTVAEFKGEAIPKEKMAEFIRTNKDLLVQEDVALETRYDPETNKSYLDVVVIEPNEMEAKVLGVQRDSLSIKDLHTGKSVHIRKSPEQMQHVPIDFKGRETFAPSEQIELDRAFAELPQDMVDYIVANKVPFEFVSKAKIDEMPDSLRAAFRLAKAMTNGKRIIIPEGAKIDANSLKHELSHIVYPKVPKHIIEKAEQNAYDVGKSIVDFVRSKKVPKELEYTARIAKREIGDLIRSKNPRAMHELLLAIPPDSWEQVARHLGLRGGGQYVTVAVGKYLGDRYNLGLFEGGERQEMFAYPMGEFPEYAQSVFSEMRREAEGKGEAWAGFRPEPGFKREPKAGLGLPTDKPMSRQEIVNFLRTKLKQVIRYGGKMRPGVLGYFKTFGEVVRSKFVDDVPTTTHEIGHALQKYLYPDTMRKKQIKLPQDWEPYRHEFLAWATPALKGQDPATEGFAEFIRLYITDENAVRQRFFGFNSYFERTMSQKSPESLEVLLQARDMWNTYRDQGSFMRILGNLSINEKEPMFKPTWNDAVRVALDDIHDIKVVVDEIMNGEKLKVSEDTYKLMRTHRGWAGKGNHFLQRSPYKFGTYENVGKSLKSILKDVEDLNELRVYLYAKRTLEKAGQGIETGISVEDAEFEVNRLGPKYEKIRKDLLEYQDHVLQYTIDAGLISEGLAAKFREKNQDYAPLYPWRIEDEGVLRSRKGGTGPGYESHVPFRKMRGGGDRRIDPVESIIKNTFVLINLAEKNAISQSLIKLVNKHEGMGKFAERVPIPLMKIDIGKQELMSILNKFKVEFTPRIERVLHEKVTETGRTTGAAPEAGPAGRVEGVVKEALEHRGFSVGETEQLIRRLKGAKTDAETQTVIEKIVERTLEIHVEREIGFEIPADGIDIFRPTAFKPQGNFINVWFKGERQLYQVDPRIARAFLNLDRESSGMLVKFLSYPASWLRAGATLTPEFMARNPLRDQFTAWVFSRYNYIPYWDFGKGIFHMLGKDDLYWEWQKGGGAQSMMVSIDRDYLQKYQGELLQKYPMHYRNPMNILRAISELGESATRLGEFGKGVKKETKRGLTMKEAIQQSAYSAREVTLDFLRIGAKTRGWNQITAFFNANLQGTDRMRRELMEHPLNFMVKVAPLTIASVLLAIANHDDPRWKHGIQQWEKDLFWIILTEDNIYRIPKPFELGIIFGSIPERIAEWVLNKTPGLAEKLLWQIGQGMVPNILPTSVLPIIENMTNYSFFFERDIEPQGMEDLLPQYRYRSYTTETAKKIGSLIASIPYIGETGAASPTKIENLVRAWSGGLGINVVWTLERLLQESKMVVPRVEKPSMTLADIPLIKGFVVRYPSSSAEAVQDFYAKYRKINMYQQTAMFLMKSEFDADKSMAIWFDEQTIKLEGHYQSMKNMQEAIRFVYNAPLPGKDKRQLIDDLYLQMIDVAVNGNEIFRELDKLHKDVKRAKHK